MSSPRNRRIGGGAAAAAAVAGLLLWLSSLAGADPRRPWLALLIGFAFSAPLAGGLAVWPAIIRLSNGRWPGPLFFPPLRAVRFAPGSLLALAALWAGSGSFAPWIGAELPQGAWLSRNFLFGRDLAALAGFWLLAELFRRGFARGGAGRAVAAVIGYCLVFTLLGVDQLMALDPHFSSSLYGGYIFISGLYAAVAAWALCAALTPGVAAERLHDLGRLTFAFCLLTTYLMYCHLLPIWYENLPHEVRLLVPRMNFAPWKWVSVFLLFSIYLGPLLFLLTVRAKRSRVVLGSVALLILFGLLVERWWLVMPVFYPRLVFGAAEAGSGLLFLGGLGFCLAWPARGESAAEGEGPG